MDINYFCKRYPMMDLSAYSLSDTYCAFAN